MAVAERYVVRAGGHVWHVLDETHMECTRCKLRLFRHARRGWLLVNFNGQPSDVRLLSDGSGAFGPCTSPRAASEMVLIAYTGDPDVHPGCERIMHAVDGIDRALVSAGALVLPRCGTRATFWELGPTRKHVGWTWCRECFPGRENERVRFPW